MKWRFSDWSFKFIFIDFIKIDRRRYFKVLTIGILSLILGIIIGASRESIDYLCLIELVNEGRSVFICFFSRSIIPFIIVLLSLNLYRYRYMPYLAYVFYLMQFIILGYEIALLIICGTLVSFITLIFIIAPVTMLSIYILSIIMTVCDRYTNACYQSGAERFIDVLKLGAVLMLINHILHYLIVLSILCVIF